MRTLNMLNILRTISLHSLSTLVSSCLSTGLLTVSPISPLGLRGSLLPSSLVRHKIPS